MRHFADSLDSDETPICSVSFLNIWYLDYLIHIHVVYKHKTGQFILTVLRTRNSRWQFTPRSFNSLKVKSGTTFTFNVILAFRKQLIELIKVLVYLWSCAKYHRKQWSPSSDAALLRRRLSWDCTIFKGTFSRLGRWKS